MEVIASVKQDCEKQKQLLEDNPNLSESYLHFLKDWKQYKQQSENKLEKSKYKLAMPKYAFGKLFTKK
ncbi:MAG: hypothetical protein ACOWWR_19115 [Eubacteriales bacterium]